MIYSHRFAAAALGGLFLTLGIAGCEHERPESLSGGSVMAVEGNRNLNYTAPNDGTVTVYDTHRDQVIYSGKIMKGQNLMVDTMNDQITIDGQKVAEKVVAGGDQHRVFFSPSEHIDKSATVQTNTTSVETVHTDR